MTLAASTHNVEPHCPRCGYDLRGVVQAWDESCPLDGTCTECGLQFEWSKVLRPEFHEPQWCVEFAPRGGKRFVSAWLKTSLRILWPWGFWSRIDMAFEVRWKRLCGFAVAWSIALVGLCALGQALVAGQVWWYENENASPNVQTAQDVHKVMKGSAAQLEQEARYLEARIAGEEELPEVNELFVRVVENAPQRQEEYLRSIQSQLQLAKQPLVEWSEGPSLLLALFEGVFLPLRNSSLHQPANQNSLLEYVPPAEIHYQLLKTRTNRGSAGVQFWRTLERCGSIGVHSIALFPLFPLLFMVLPISRRKARVRWAHIWRAAIYSMTPLFIAAGLSVFTLILAMLPWMPIELLLDIAPLWLWLPLTLLLPWWATAIVRYMQIPRGWFVAIVFLITALLIYAAIDFWVGELFFKQSVSWRG